MQRNRCSYSRDRRLVTLLGSPSCSHFSSIPAAILLVAFPPGGAVGTAAAVILYALLTFVVVAPALAYRSMGMQPSDVLVCKNGIHLFWRLFAKARHRFLEFDSIRSVQIKDGWFSPVRSPVFVLESGEEVRLAILAPSRTGPRPLYRVTHNATPITFGDRLHPPSHDEAFRDLLVWLVPAKVQQGAGSGL